TPAILHTLETLETIQSVTDGDATITTDVGQHQMWCAQYYHFSRPRQFITSGGFGTMGFGLGAAMGAAVGNPGKVVVQCTGDGCFRMNCHELCTAEHYNIPVITVIFNNRTLGMVRQWQNLIYHKRFSQTDLDRGPDFEVGLREPDRKSTRLNSSHVSISYAVFCLKKKKI